MKEYLPFLFSTLMLLNYFTLPCREHTQQNGRETSCDKRHKNFVWTNFPPHFTFPLRQIFLLKTRNVNFIVKWRSRQNRGLIALPCLSHGSPLLFLPSCCVLFTIAMDLNVRKEITCKWQTKQQDTWAHFKLKTTKINLKKTVWQHSLIFFNFVHLCCV